MVKKFSLVLNNNIVKCKLLPNGVHVSNSLGVLSAYRFLGEFLAFINGPDFARDLFPLGSYGRRFQALFMPNEYDGKLLRDSVKRSNRMSTELNLDSIFKITIKFMFYESGKKECFASFKINLFICSGAYNCMEVINNITGEKTSFQ